MRKLLALILFSVSVNSFAQVSSNRSCITALNLCTISPNDTLETDFDNCAYGTSTTLWYYIYIPSTQGTFAVGATFISPAPGHIESYTIYGPMDNNLGDACADETPPVLSTQTYDPAEDTLTVTMGYAEGLYLVKLVVDDCSSSIDIVAGGKNPYCEIDTLACENCIGSFQPEPGKKYVVSAWATQTITSGSYPTTFTNPRIYIDYTGETSAGPFTPSGPIIDDWQRIEGVFTIPAGADDIKIRLQSNSGDVYFDDIRIFPYDGSMKTYVYDPVTLRLVAELDERNFATIYEYDEEGKLLRVKKETERGVMTIQETRTNVQK